MSDFRKRKIGLNSTKSFLLGGLATCIYYAIIHLPMFHGTVLHTYTTEHITEYAIVALFFWVNTELLFAYLLSRENAAGLNYEWLPSRKGMESPSYASKLLEMVNEGPARLQNTMMAWRLRSALTFVSERQSAEGFRDYLNDLASHDADEVYARYNFPKFVTALLPILGLLGTVVHFGSTLSGLSASELAEKVPEIVSGIGTAFNTTCAALSASITTLLIRFVAERREEGIVQRINNYMQAELLHRFSETRQSVHPFHEALVESQETTLHAMGLYEQSRAQEWSDRMDRICDQFVKADQSRDEKLEILVQTFDKIQRENNKELKGIKAEFHTASSLAMDIANALNADGHLIQLQEQLAQNLSVLRQTQQFDQTMHELTAAIHLLTARHSGPGQQGGLKAA